MSSFESGMRVLAGLPLSIASEDIFSIEEKYLSSSIPYSLKDGTLQTLHISDTASMNDDAA